MWANRDWVGRYLPEDTPPGRELAAYSRLCNAAEGNTTFYGLPREATVRRWQEQTGPGFRFAFKLPRTITHERRLRDGREELRAMMARLEPLADRLGPICVQLPASFEPEALPVLERFLAARPRAVAWSVEVRHRRFFAGGDSERALNDLLHATGVNRVILDTRALFDGPRATPAEREARASKPRLPVRAVATGTQPVVRFVGQTSVEANPAYWEPWVRPVVRWLEQGLSPLVFLHTPDNVVAPELARRFHAVVAARSAVLEPLSEPPDVTTTPKLFDA